MAWHKNTSRAHITCSRLCRLCRLWGSKEATASQAENVGLHCTKEKRRQGEEITFLDADLRLTLAGPLRVRSASPRSTAKTEKPPRVSADRRCWARHTQEGCCCHTQMHETVNLSALYEKAWEGKGGGGEEGVLCSYRGGSVDPGHRRFLLAPFPVCLRAHTPNRHPGRLTCKEVWM